MKLDKAAILIKKAALEFDKVANEVLSTYDLTASQYKVIKFVYEERGVRITDLEKYYSMSHPTAIGIVRNLEKKGLISYQVNPNDGRSRYIVPTEKAMEQKKVLYGLGDQLEEKMTSRLSDEERKKLIRLLQKTLDLPQE